MGTRESDICVVEAMPALAVGMAFRAFAWRTQGNSPPAMVLTGCLGFLLSVLPLAHMANVS
jgi:hypothetical protein